MLQRKKILVAVCGSIAAYKTAFLVRLLIKEEAEVQVIMTESAKNFITPLTLSTLSKKAVYSEYFDAQSGTWCNHVTLGLWADLMIIAPLSANTLGKMANGICDNLLLATYLSAKCPVMVAPTMDLDMYQHPTTHDNLDKLRAFGNIVIDARVGDLASSLKGKGRMAEPEELLEEVKKRLSFSANLQGKKVLITSGPTFEKIDPVRFIGNYSSGKMGLALKQAFESAGCEVKVITGPATHLPTTGNIEWVTSAEEMFEKVEKAYSESDIIVFAAAVADYRPATISPQKIKNTEAHLRIKLVKNPDIAERMGKIKTNKVHVGFALETENEEENARKKQQSKNFDLIVLNSLNDKDAGFKSSKNKVTFFDRNNNRTEFQLKHKTDVAIDIVRYISKYLCE